ncbi:hypothetical protein [Limimaricola cinnabarinus]|uniref:Uncharacterized protein n=1 Tax=Limimaricola cinnabarinus TaxID=1125964 RepID=A0A2G1MC99_9RHOB|nr:hypothetical protein [Limimaricola cinnabarinus]PHP26292.1 hypothetical protein CJ301_17120 [Limimaricola cinnabarinus]
MSFDPAPQPAPQSDPKRPGPFRLASLLGRLGTRAAAFLLAQIPRLLIALLLRASGAAFDQQVLRWMAASIGALGDLW